MFKETIRFTFQTEGERRNFGNLLDGIFSDETRITGVIQEKKFYKMNLNVVNKEEIGETFKLLQKVEYEIPEN